MCVCVCVCVCTHAFMCVHVGAVPEYFGVKSLDGMRGDVGGVTHKDIK